MPVHLIDNRDERSIWGIWRIEEEPEELEGSIPPRTRSEDPILRQGVFPKRVQRMAVRALLQEIFPEGGPIGYDGKRPLLRNAKNPISITHDPEFVGIQIGMSDRPVGIDLQKQRPDQLKRVADRFLNREELEWLAGLKEKERIKALNILWCAKEALYKVCQGSLRGAIGITPFRIAEQGKLSASVEIRKERRSHFQLAYRSIGEHHLVHIVDGYFI